MPEVVLHGRLWGEEGRDFFVHAATMPWWTALTVTYAGYLNLAANGAALVAHALVPLEAVPYVTIGMALIAQCCPAILLIGARDRWLHPRPALIAALLLVATPPLVEEVWLQTLTIQFHLALGCVLILALDVPGRALALFGGLLLFLAPLCGPSAVLLVPLFLVRAGFERSKARLWQGVALGAGVALQLGIFYMPQAGRHLGIGPVVFLCVLYVKHLVVPFIGRDGAEAISDDVQARLAAGSLPWEALLITCGAFAGLGVALLRRRASGPLWLFVCALLTGFLAYYGAIDGGAHLLIIGNEGRYSFLPEVLLALALLGVATGRQAPERWLARLAVVWLIIVGVFDLTAPSPAMKEGPDWAGEVAAWRENHGHPIAIWPEGWTMKLDHD